MPDAGIRDLSFYCMTLDMCYTCSQLSRETKGWRENHVPSAGSSEATPLLAQVMWKEPYLQQEDCEPEHRLVLCPSLVLSPTS